MVTFAFLGNTLFLTILVSMLSNTFSTIVSNATAEIQFRHTVLTLEGVKSDAIFAYLPPFNILAMLVLVPLRFVVSPRWFHKIHVASVRLINLPLLLIIAVAERRTLWSGLRRRPSSTSLGKAPKSASWFWEKWRITVHSDIEAVFELPPPESVVEEIAADDDMTVHLIRRQFIRHNTAESGTIPKFGGGGTAAESGTKQGDGRETSKTASDSVASGASQKETAKTPPLYKTPSRRDSITNYPGLAQELRGALSGSDEVSDITSRLEALEDSTARIEDMLRRLIGGIEEMESVEGEEDNEAIGRTGKIDDLDKSAVGE
jgi:hypothetical protein